MDEPFETYPGYQVPEPYVHKPVTKATRVYKEWWFWLIMAVIGVVIIIGIGVGIYFLVKELTKSSKYQIPANTPNVKTTLANITPASGSNGPYYSKNNACTLATDANAIGWQITNNTGVTLSNIIRNVGNGINNCNGFLASTLIPPNLTVNWFNSFDSTSKTYFTYYPQCTIVINNSNNGFNGAFTQTLSANINPANQYIQITVTSSSNNVIQATTQVITI